MRCETIEQPSSIQVSLWERLVAAITFALAMHRRRICRIEFDDMPDRVKRDMGFLDGREPYREEDYLSR